MNNNFDGSSVYYLNLKNLNTKFLKSYLETQIFQIDYIQNKIKRMSENEHRNQDYYEYLKNELEFLELLVSYLRIELSKRN